MVEAGGGGEAGDGSLHQGGAHGPDRVDTVEGREGVGGWGRAGVGGRAARVMPEDDPSWLPGSQGPGAVHGGWWPCGPITEKPTPV